MGPIRHKQDVRVDPMKREGESSSPAAPAIQHPAVSSTQESQDVAMSEKTHESNASAASGRAANGSGTVLSLPRQMGIGKGIYRFSSRQFFTLYTFNTWFARGAWSILGLPMYVFNTSVVGHYLDSRAMDLLHGLVALTSNCRVLNVSGTLSAVGVNAPFVAQTEQQTATNSQLTLTALVARGLERAFPIAEGTAELATLTPEVTKWGTADTVHYSDSYEILNTNLGLNKITQVKTEEAHSVGGFQEYKATAAMIGPTTTDEKQVIASNNIPKHMKLFDATQAQGELFSWNHDMEDSFLHVAKHNVVRNQFVGLQPDHRMESATTGTSIGYAEAGPNYNITETLLPNESTKSQWYLTHNNAYKVGSSLPKHQHLLPKEYVYIVPPPTVSNKLIQDAYISTVMDAEIVVEINATDCEGYDTNSMLYLPKGGLFYGYRNCNLDGTKWNELGDISLA